MINLKIDKRNGVVIAITIVGVIALILLVLPDEKTSEMKMAQKNIQSISSEDFIILKFDSNNYLITSNPIEADSIIAITLGKSKLESQCETFWPPILIEKEFSNGVRAHMYHVRTKETCNAGMPIEKFIENNQKMEE